MSKRSISVGILTVGLSAGVVAGAIAPAAAQGTPVGGEGNVYFLGGALPGKYAQEILVFGDKGDQVYFGDWYSTGIELPMVRRGNVYFVPDQYTSSKTAEVFAYGDISDEVLVGDWDGDGYDSLAVKRGNHYFVKNDVESSGVADSDFYYGDAGDTVLTGNWDGVRSPVPSVGVDNNGDGDFTDAATPAAAPDLHPTGQGATDRNGDGDTTDPGDAPVAADPGYDADEDGDYSDAGDRAPGTGVDNNKDGDFTDPGNAATEADVAPGTGGKGDTIMIQRGNQFFVKNSISTGVADYTFFFGDKNDQIMVGDWATPAKAETASASAAPAASSDGADQLAVRRGNVYHTSSELAEAKTKKTNPTTTRSFAYGDATDVVFVAALPSEETDEFGKLVDSDPVTAGVQADDIYGDGMGVRRAL